MILKLSILVATHKIKQSICKLGVVQKETDAEYERIPIKEACVKKYINIQTINCQK
jgi:hypothetical protein